MPHPTDSDERKRRDREIRTQDQAIADHLAQAQRSGELAAAPSFGKPLAEMEGWSETPGELRMPFKILKDSGALPPEIEMFHKRARLREALAAAGTDEERKHLSLQLSEVEQAISLRLESLRTGGRL